MLRIGWTTGLKNKDVTWQQVQRGHFISTGLLFFFFFPPFRQSIMWTSFSEGHLQLPSSQHASLSCVCLPFSPPRPFHPLKHACMHPDTLTSWKWVGVVVDLGGQAGEVWFAKWEVDNKVQRTKMPPSQPFSPRSTSVGRLGPEDGKGWKWTRAVLDRTARVHHSGTLVHLLWRFSTAWYGSPQQVW